jgi:hypothetical protein
MQAGPALVAGSVHSTTAAMFVTVPQPTLV